MAIPHMIEASQRRYEFETDDADEALRFMSRICSPHEPVVERSGSPPHLRMTSTAIDDCRVQSFEYAGSGRTRFTATTHVNVLQLLSGSLRIGVDKATVSLRDG